MVELCSKNGSNILSIYVVLINLPKEENSLTGEKISQSGHPARKKTFRFLSA
jgi:hypothetical protein